MKQPKYQIGETVYNTVERKGSYEPSICEPNSKLVINGIKQHQDSFRYTCDIDGYVFEEEKLISKDRMEMLQKTIDDIWPQLWKH